MLFRSEDKGIIVELKKLMAVEIINNFIEEMRSLGFDNGEIIEIVSDKIKKEE